MLKRYLLLSFFQSVQMKMIILCNQVEGHPLTEYGARFLGVVDQHDTRVVHSQDKVGG